MVFCLQIDRIFYPVKTLGPGSRIGIWTIGCPHACFNCSNQELWEEQPDKDLPIQKVMKMVEVIEKPVDGLTISGGEPFEQPEELYELVEQFRMNFTDDILIYSGYTIEQLQNKKQPMIDEILQKIAVLIDGKYIEKLNDNSPLRGSSNQRIHYINDNYWERYNSLLEGNRKVQTIMSQDELFTIGIPVKGYRDYLETGLDKQYGIKLSNQAQQ